MPWLQKIHNGVKGFEPYGVILAVIGLILTLLTYAAETNDRQAERIFKAWEIVSSEKNVGSSKRRAMEYLNMQWEGSLCGVPFSTMLRWVSPDPRQECIFPKKARESLFGLKVAEADLRGADLRGADLGGADLSSADFAGTKISQEQLNRACQHRLGESPDLPEGLTWHGRICERYKKKADKTPHPPPP